jgi:hypothetical protein
MKNHNGNEMTLRDLLAVFCADIEVFLLRDEEQENYLDKLYSKEEILEQLEKTLKKTLNLPINPKLYDVPLFTSLAEFVLKKEGFSKSQIEFAKKNTYEA